MRSSANTFHNLPILLKAENNVLLLLTWSTMASSRQIKILSDWARSVDGWNLYTQLIDDFQDP